MHEDFQVLRDFRIKTKRLEAFSVTQAFIITNCNNIFILAKMCSKNDVLTATEVSLYPFNM